MKYFLLNICFYCYYFISMAATSNFIPEDQRVHGENGWYVPLKDNKTEWVNKEDLEEYMEQCAHNVELGISNNVTFFLYTKKNPTSPQELMPYKDSIAKSNFNKDNPTRVCIHGWQSDKEGYINTGVRDAWLSKGEFNYIFVQWDAAKSWVYGYSAQDCFFVGAKISTFLHYLVRNFGVDLNKLIIIGHSLGAHIAGFTSKHFKLTQVGTIIGLDPALPLFDINNPDTRLSSTDGQYVQSIHTNGGRFGFLKAIGKGSFYPNGGQVQPACTYDPVNVCDHSMAIYYYVEAVQINDFNSMRCLNDAAAAAKKCGINFSNVRMGAINDTSKQGGVFFVPVHKDSPYGFPC